MLASRGRTSGRMIRLTDAQLHELMQAARMVPPDLRDVFLERVAVELQGNHRPIRASQPPRGACKTSKHYRSRLARPLFFGACTHKSRSSGDRWLMSALPAKRDLLSVR